tara:strand:+ start:1110 stop:1232 length:123 start_codon:yes stop_codon:yes gene_type:complete
LPYGQFAFGEPGLRYAPQKCEYAILPHGEEKKNPVVALNK